MMEVGRKSMTQPRAELKPPRDPKHRSDPSSSPPFPRAGNILGNASAGQRRLGMKTQLFPVFLYRTCTQTLRRYSYSYSVAKFPG